LFDVRTGQELRTLLGHAGPVNGVALSPDGQTAVSVGDDQKVILWPARDEADTKTVHRPNVDLPFAVALSANGATVVAEGERSGLTFWDATRQPWQKLRDIRETRGQARVAV